MPEAEKEKTKAAEEDLIEGGTEHDPDDGMVVALSRGVGAAARSMSDGLQSVAELLRGRPREPRRTKQPAERLEELLGRLKQLVAEHGDDPAALGAQEDFWLLIGKLYQIHRRKRLQRSPDQGGAPRDAPAARKKRAVTKTGAEAKTGAAAKTEAAAAEATGEADKPPAEAEPAAAADEAESERKKRKK